MDRPSNEILFTVSGSNGKSTTASLIAHLLEACSGPTGQVLLSGNERTRQVPLQELAACSSQDVAIWEVSGRYRVAPLGN